MRLTLTLEAEEGLLEAGLDSFVRQNGWADGSDMSQVDFAKMILMNYFRGQVLEYNAMRIGNPMEGVTQVLDAVSATLRTE